MNLYLLMLAVFLGGFVLGMFVMACLMGAVDLGRYDGDDDYLPGEEDVKPDPREGGFS